MMNRMTAVGMILGIIAAGTAVADYSVGTVDVLRVPNYYNGWGGEYTICDTSLSMAAYAAVARVPTTSTPSFQSFCVEQDEFIYPPENDLDASLGIAAVLGGAGGPDPDPIGPEVAWLYTQFATGKLTGYDYTPGTGRVASAGALQRLIWSLEEEGGGTGWVVNPATFEKVTLVQSQLDLIASWKAAYDGSGWTGIGGVRVLNLERWNAQSGAYEVAQSQLYLVPAPGAILLGLLGLASAGMKLRRCRP